MSGRRSGAFLQSRLKVFGFHLNSLLSFNLSHASRIKDQRLSTLVILEDSTVIDRSSSAVGDDGGETESSWEGSAMSGCVDGSTLGLIPVGTIIS